MNKEQAKSLVRWVITAFGASLATFLATLGWVDYDSLMALLNSEWFIGLLATGISMATGSLGWSMAQHTASNAVAVVASMPDADLRSSGVSKVYATPELAAKTSGTVVIPVLNVQAATGVGRRA